MSTVIEFKTGYLDAALDNLPGVIDRAQEVLSGVEFDTLVGTGFSGALVVPMLATQMGKPFVLVRKPNDGSHHNGSMIGHLGKRWVFVDDFVSSGLRALALRRRLSSRPTITVTRRSMWVTTAMGGMTMRAVTVRSSLPGNRCDARHSVAHRMVVSRWPA